MPTRRIGATFETRGASRYAERTREVADAHARLARSLPAATESSRAYERQLRSINRQLKADSNEFERFRNVLIRTEIQAKRSRLGFTQFRKSLSSREIRAYSTEIGRLDHLLGSTNRTLRVTNQRLADQGFSRLRLERVTRVSRRHLNDLQRTRRALKDAFNVKEANDYVQSLRQVERSLRQISATSREFQQFDVPTIGRRGRVDTRRISREFDFPQRRRRRIRDVPFDAVRGANRRVLGGAVDRRLLNPARDAQARISRNQRELRNINRITAPLERRVQQAQSGLRTIQAGTASAINDLERQIELYTELSNQGRRGAERQLRSLREQHDFITRNVKTRENELLVAQRTLNIARARTQQSRTRLDLENQALRTAGLQRTLGQNAFNVLLQTGKIIGKNLGVKPVRGLSRAISSTADAAHRLRTETEGTRLERIFGRDARGSLTSAVQTINNLVTGIRNLERRGRDFPLIGPRRPTSARERIQSAFQRDTTAARQLRSDILRRRSQLDRGIAREQFFRQTGSAGPLPTGLTPVASRIVQEARIARRRSDYREARGLSRRTSFREFSLEGEGRQVRDFQRFRAFQRYREGVSEPFRLLQRARELDPRTIQPSAERRSIRRGILRGLGQAGGAARDEFQRSRQSLRDVAESLRNPIRQLISESQENRRQRQAINRLSVPTPGILSRAALRIQGRTRIGETDELGDFSRYRSLRRTLRFLRDPIGQFRESREGERRVGRGVERLGLSTASPEIIERGQERIETASRNLAETLSRLRGRVRDAFRLDPDRRGSPSPSTRERRSLFPLIRGTARDSRVGRFARDFARGLPEGVVYNPRATRQGAGRYQDLANRSRFVARGNVPTGARVRTLLEGSILPSNVRGQNLRTLINQELRPFLQGIREGRAGRAFERARAFGRDFRRGEIPEGVEFDSRRAGFFRRGRFVARGDIPAGVRFRERLGASILPSNTRGRNLRALFEQELSPLANLARSISNSGIGRFARDFARGLPEGVVYNPRATRQGAGRYQDLANRSRFVARGNVPTGARVRTLLEGSILPSNVRGQNLRTLINQELRPFLQEVRQFGSDFFRGQLPEGISPAPGTGRFRGPGGRFVSPSDIPAGIRVREQSLERFPPLLTDVINSLNEIRERGSETFNRIRERASGFAEDTRTVFSRLSNVFTESTESSEGVETVWTSIRGIFVGLRDVIRGSGIEVFTNWINLSERFADRWYGIEGVLQGVVGTLRDSAELFVRFLSSARDIPFRKILAGVVRSLRSFVLSLRNVPSLLTRIFEGAILNLARISSVGLRPLFKAVGALSETFVASLPRAFEALRRGAVSILDVIRRLPQTAQRFYDTLQRTRRLFGNIRVLTEGIRKSIATTAFTGVRDILRLAQNIGPSLRTPGGLIDSFRSTEAQLEKIDNRLRTLGRNIAAPTERLQFAQSRFNLIEAKTQASLRVLNRKIEDLDTATREINRLNDEIKNIRETQLEPVQLELEIKEGLIRDGIITPLETELELLQNRTNRIFLDTPDESGIVASQSLTYGQLEVLHRQHLERVQSLNAALPHEVRLGEVEPTEEQGRRLQELSEVRARLFAINDAFIPLRSRINEIQEALSVNESRLIQQLAPLREQERHYKGLIRSAQSLILRERQRDDRQTRRVDRYKETRRILEERLKQEREILDDAQAQFNVIEAQVDQERTLLNIRKERLKVRQETGAGASTLVGAIGDTARSAKEGIQSRQITNIGTGLQRVTDRTDVAESGLAGFSARLRQVTGDGQQFNAVFGDTGDVLQDIEEHAESTNRGLLSRFQAEVSEIINNPIESFFTISRIVTRNVVGLAENVVSTLTGLTVRAGRLLGRVALRAVDGIASLIVKVFELIPIVGGALQGIYDLLRGVVSAIGEFVLGVASRIAGLVQGIFSRLYNVVRSIISVLADLVENIIRGLITRVTTSIQNFVTSFVTSVASIAERLAVLYISALRSVASSIAGVFAGFTNAIRGYIEGAVAIVVNNIETLAEVTFNVLVAPFRLLVRFIRSPFDTLRDIIFGIGAAIRDLILLPLRPIIAVISAPIRALGFILSAFNYNTVPETISTLKTVQEEGTKTAGVFENVSKSIAKSLQDNNRLSASSLKAYRPIRRESEDLGKGLIRNIRGVDDIVRILTQGVQSLTTSVSTLHTSFSNLSLGAAALTVLLGGVLVAAKRASQFKGIILSFRRTGTALEELREAAGHTVRDIDLMRSANIALSNAAEPVREAFAEDLPEVMQIARQQAIRTGESTKFLFESITAGIKRSSPKLIDNTGLVIKIGRANEIYADRLGKTVKELTAVDTQLALLEEVLRAGQEGLVEIGDETEGAQQKFERFGAQLSNLADRITFGLQPALEGFLNFLNRILINAKQFSIDIASALFVGTTVITHGTARLFNDFGQTTRNFIRDLFNLIGLDTSELTSGVLKTLEDIFLGAVRTFGLIAGTISGIWQVITETIIGALEDIGKVLIGESPPKEGPLKNVDKGAAAIMEAWQEGFTGVSINRIEDYASTIESVLNRLNVPAPSDILRNAFEEAQRRFGSLSTEEIEERIKQLDEAIVPFEKRLEIIRTHFEAIQKASEFSLKAIERQVNRLLQDVVDGSEAAAEQVRNLDDLYGRIVRNNALDAERLDQAAISIEIAKARQAEERALLDIILAEKKAEEDRDKAKEKQGSDAEAEAEAEGIIYEPLGDPLAGFLREGTERFAADANTVFDEAYREARTFIRGEPDPLAPEGDFYEKSRDDLVGLGDYYDGNFIERAFSDLPETLKDLPSNVQNVLEDFRQRMEDALNSPVILDVEMWLNDILGLTGTDYEIDFSEIFNQFWDFFSITLPDGVRDAINRIADKIGLNEFIRTIFDLPEEWTLGAAIVGFPAWLLSLPSTLVTHWEDYINRLNKLEAAGEITSQTPFIDRFFAALFNEGFTLDIPAAAGVVWTYFTDRSEGGLTEFEKDIQEWWEDNNPIEDALTRLRTFLTAASTFAGTLVGLVLDVAFSVADILLFNNDDAGSSLDDKEGSFATTLISGIVTAIRNILAFPFTLAGYLGNTPLDEISVGGLILHFVGWDEAQAEVFFGEGNKFLNETLPNAIDEALGEGNFITRLYEIGNSFRRRVHDILFGESLAPVQPVPSGDIAVQINRLNDEIKADLERIESIPANQGNLGLVGLQILDDDVAEVKRKQNALKDLQKQYEAAYRTEQEAPQGLIADIVDAVEGLPDQISEFLGENPNFLNLHSILLAARLIEEETTLQSIWEDFVDEFTQFTDDPIGYLTDQAQTVYTNFKNGLLDWVNAEDNPIVDAIDSVVQTITNDPDFSIATALAEAFTSFENIGTSIQIALGLLPDPSISPVTSIDPNTGEFIVEDLESKTLFQVLADTALDIKDRFVKYVNDHPENFSLLDSIIQFFTGTELTFTDVVNAVNDEINRLIEEASGGDGELSTDDLGEALAERVPAQSRVALDELFSVIFNQPIATEDVPEFISNWFTEIPNRVQDYVDNIDTEAGESVSIGGYIGAILDVDTADLLPNIISAFVGLPGAIVDFLASTNLFGTTVNEAVQFPEIEEPEPIDLAGAYEGARQDRDAAFKELAQDALEQRRELEEIERYSGSRLLPTTSSERLEVDTSSLPSPSEAFRQAREDEEARFATEVRGNAFLRNIQEIESVQPRRVFSLKPLLDGIVSFVTEDVAAYFDTTPLGQFILGAIKWFSGDDDLTWQGLAEEFVNYVNETPGNRNSIIQGYLDKHDNLFGIDSILQFVSGDEELTLAKLWPDIVAFFSGDVSDPRSLSRQLQNLLDGFTGDIRLGDVRFGPTLADPEFADIDPSITDPNAIIGNRGNIFQRLGLALANLAGGIWDSFREGLRAFELDDEDNPTGIATFLGLPNLVSALTGGKFTSFSAWFDTLSDEIESDLGGNEEGKNWTFPDHIQALTEFITRLFNPEIETQGEGGVDLEKSPVATFLDDLGDVFDDEVEGSLAWHLNAEKNPEGFAGRVDLFFSHTMPNFIKGLESGIRSIRRAFFAIQVFFASLPGGGGVGTVLQLEGQSIETQDDLIAYLAGGDPFNLFTQNALAGLDSYGLDFSDPSILSLIKGFGVDGEQLQTDIVNSFLASFNTPGLLPEERTDLLESFVTSFTFSSDFVLTEAQKKELLGAAQGFDTEVAAAFVEAFGSSTVPGKKEDSPIPDVPGTAFAGQGAASVNIESEYLDQLLEATGINTLVNALDPESDAAKELIALTGLNADALYRELITEIVSRFGSNNRVPEIENTAEFGDLSPLELSSEDVVLMILGLDNLPTDLDEETKLKLLEIANFWYAQIGLSFDEAIGSLIGVDGEPVTDAQRLIELLAGRGASYAISQQEIIEIMNRLGITELYQTVRETILGIVAGDGSGEAPVTVDTPEGQVGFYSTLVDYYLRLGASSLPEGASLTEIEARLRELDLYDTYAGFISKLDFAMLALAGQIISGALPADTDTTNLSTEGKVSYYTALRDFLLQQAVDTLPPGATSREIETRLRELGLYREYYNYVTALQDAQALLTLSVLSGYEAGSNNTTPEDEVRTNTSLVDFLLRQAASTLPAGASVEEIEARLKELGLYSAYVSFGQELADAQLRVFRRARTSGPYGGGIPPEAFDGSAGRNTEILDDFITESTPILGDQSVEDYYRNTSSYYALYNLGEDLREAQEGAFLAGYQGLATDGEPRDPITGQTGAIIESSDDSPREPITGQVGSILDGLGLNDDNFGDHGSNHAGSYIDKLIDGLDTGIANDALPNLSETIEPYSSPPISGPLKDLDTWGETVGKSYSDGLVSGINQGITENSISSLVNTLKPQGAEGLPVIGPLKDIRAWGGTVGQAWVSSFTEKFQALVRSGEDEGEGTNHWYTVLQGIYDKTVEFAELLPQAFEGMPDKLWDALGDPVVKMLNVIIDRYNTFIREINVSSGAISQELGIADFSISEAQKVSEDRPSFLGAEQGGVFGPGGLIVGERGPELIVPARQIAVFPNQATRNLQDIRALLQGRHQQPIYNNHTNTYNTYNNDDHTMHVTIQGNDSNNILMKLRANQIRQRG